MLQRGLPSLDGKLERFVTKKWEKWLPNSSKTDYTCSLHTYTVWYCENGKKLPIKQNLRRSLNIYWWCHLVVRSGLKEVMVKLNSGLCVTVVLRCCVQIVTAEQQEKKTFVITGVIDPRNGEEISMQQAVMLGILNQKQGTPHTYTTSTLL